MLVVRMVQVTVDQVIDVVAMGDRLVTAVGAVGMASVVAGAVVVGSALLGVLGAHAHGMLGDRAVGAHMVQVAVVDVVDVVLVGDRSVAAVAAMDVGVVGVIHGVPFWLEGECS